MSASDFPPPLPASLAAERDGDIALLRPSRAQKRNALDDATILRIETFFTAIPDGIRAVVLHGAGTHFSAGLDLGELAERDPASGYVMESLMAAIARGDAEAKVRLKDFLEKRAPKVLRS